MYISVEARRESSRQYYRFWREAALKILGDSCLTCGYRDKRALQIDHINGYGTRERKMKKLHGYKYYQHIYNEVLLGNITKYQILCANCNRIKVIEKAEYPHQNIV